MKEKLSFNQMQGVVEFYTRNAKSQDWQFESSHNVIVNNARKILRDLVFKTTTTEAGEVTAPNIEYLVLGDMNLTETDIVSEASIDDKTMINTTLTIPIKDTINFPNNTIEKTEYKGANAIKYTFVIDRSQGNTGTGFFNELGLAISMTDYPEAYLFSKLNRSPIKKTADDEITIIYYLIF